MINILLEGHNITHSWLYEELKNYIKPSHRVTVIPFAFRDRDVCSLDDWNRLFGKKGYIYSGIANGFSRYGIPEENITVINYFTDTKERAVNKIKWSDIIYFPGGLPHKIMERIDELELYQLLASYDGIVMGNSAGALVQLENYHLSPDHDYPEFGYYKGLPYINDFYLEVHYDGSEIQDSSIQKVLEEKGKTVYATALMSGGIVVDEGKIKLLGEVKKFTV